MPQARAHSPAPRGRLEVVKTLAILAFFLTGCGIPLGPVVAPNDSAPSGQVLAQGAFNSLNGKSVTGNALIYSSSSGYYVLRLEGISAPDEVGLEASVYASGRTVYTTSLRYISGSQNYAFAASGIATWNYVTIRSVPNNRDYGQALLIDPR